MLSLEIKKIPSDYTHPANLPLEGEYGIYEDDRLILSGTEESLDVILKEVRSKVINNGL